MFGIWRSRHIILTSSGGSRLSGLMPTLPAGQYEVNMFGHLLSVATRTKSVVASALLLSFFLPAPVWSQYNRSTPVETALAEEQVLARQITVQGRVRSGLPHEISAPLTAVTRIEALRTGDFVEQGQTLAVQDTDDLKTQRQRTMLRLSETRQSENQAKTDLTFRIKLAELAMRKLELLRQRAERAQSLVNRGTLSAEAYETVQGNLLAAEEQLITRQQAVSQLQAQLSVFSITLQQLQLDLDELDRDIRAATLIAPVSGQLVELVEGNNRFLREGDSVASIRNQQDFEIEAQIPADYIGFVEQAGEVQASYGNRSPNGGFAAREPLNLVFRATLPLENSRTGTRTVRFKAAAALPASLQADNTPVNIHVPSGQPEPVITIPQDAIIPVSAGHIVFVVSEDRAKRRIVALGGTDGNNVIITTGLSAGDIVVVKGNEGLSDGSKVQLPGRQPKGQAGGKRPNGQAGKKPQQAASQ